MQDASSFLLKHMDTLVRLGAQMWPVPVCTLYNRFMRNALLIALQGKISVLTHDASIHGIGMAHRESQDSILHTEGRRYS